MRKTITEKHTNTEQNSTTNMMEIDGVCSFLTCSFLLSVSILGGLQRELDLGFVTICHNLSSPQN
jgi:hypothetical protein